MSKSGKQRSVRLLIMYVIGALLFLTSIDLHIHTREAAASADHGMAVSISAISDNLVSGSAAEEINVSPDGVLKVPQVSFQLLVLLLLVAILLVSVCRSCIARWRDSQRLLPIIPFHGAPPLRAPPQ